MSGTNWDLHGGGLDPFYAGGEPDYDDDHGVFRPGENHVELASGRYLDLTSPDPAIITVEDIAHHLSMTCRYVGAVRRFYSVAEHACLVAARLEEQGCDAATILHGLHHDDAEAFVGDVTRPLKSLVQGYRDLEAKVQLACVTALNLPRIGIEDWNEIGRADDWALSCEAFQLMPSQGRGWFCWGYYQEAGGGYDMRFPYDMLGMSPEEAERRYLWWHGEASA